MSKMDEFKQLVIKNKYHIVGITESWAHQHINEGELHIDGYNMYRKDRQHDSVSKGGGVLLYIKDTLVSEEVQILNSDHFEDSVWAKIVSHNSNIIVGVCYRSPTSTDINNGRLLQLLDTAVSRVASTHVMILGDFNYPGIDYDNLAVAPGSKAATDFFDKTMDLFLIQNITECTRYRQGQRSSKLDYIFTDEENLVENVEYLPPLGKSDHVCISFKYLLGDTESSDSTQKLNYWKADYVKIREELSAIDWATEFESKDTNGMWQKFHNRMLQLIHQFTPLKKDSYRNNRKKNSWITKATVKVMKKRNKAWSTYKQLPTSRNCNIYKTLRNKVCKLIKRDKTNFQQTLIGNFRHHPKRFYGYMRNTQTVKSKVPRINKQDGGQTCTDGDTASVLCEYFSSVFTAEPDLKQSSSDSNKDLFAVVVTEELVEKALTKLKSDKSPGPDGLHPMLLRESLPHRLPIDKDIPGIN